VEFKGRRKSTNVEVRTKEDAAELMNSLDAMQLLQLLTEGTGPARTFKMLTDQGDFFDPDTQAVPDEGLKALALARELLKAGLADNGDPVSQRPLPSLQAQQFEGIDTIEDIMALFGATSRKALLAPIENKEEAFASAGAERQGLEDAVRLLVESLTTKPFFMDRADGR
jgi:hypothetical protein